MSELRFRRAAAADLGLLWRCWLMTCWVHCGKTRCQLLMTASRFHLPRLMPTQTSFFVWSRRGNRLSGPYSSLSFRVCRVMAPSEDK